MVSDFLENYPMKGLQIANLVADGPLTMSSTSWMGAYCLGHESHRSDSSDSLDRTVT